LHLAAAASAAMSSTGRSSGSTRRDEAIRAPRQQAVLLLGRRLLRAAERFRNDTSGAVMGFDLNPRQGRARPRREVSFATSSTPVREGPLITTSYERRNGGGKTIRTSRMGKWYANDLSLEPFIFPEGRIVHTPTHPGNGIEGTRRRRPRACTISRVRLGEGIPIVEMLNAKQSSVLEQPCPGFMLGWDRNPDDERRGLIRRSTPFA
jgi:hypothetical protein